MTYSKYDKITTTDLTTIITNYNSLWGVGYGNEGYGQTQISIPSQTYDYIPYTNISTVTDVMNRMSYHQNTSLTAVTNPSRYESTLSTTLSTINTNYNTISTPILNARAQATSSSNSQTTSGGLWGTQKTFTFTVTFASGNAARYFFNSGGQLAISCTHGYTSTSMDSLLNTLCSRFGTLYLSSPTSTASATIAGTSFTGTTKVGGNTGGSGTTTATTIGYYSLTTANQQMHKQVAESGLAGYTGSYITLNVKSNGTQNATYADRGSVITFTILWDIAPDGANIGLAGTNNSLANAGASSYVTLTVKPPTTHSSGLSTASWGTPTIASSVA